MKKVLLLLYIVVAYTEINAQVQAELKTEYFAESSYRREDGDNNPKVGNSKGSAMVYQANVSIPLSMTLNQNKRPTAWTINTGLTYAKLDNKNFEEPLVVDEIFNYGISLVHLRPLNDKWSMAAALGGGIFMPTTKMSQIGFRNVLLSGSAVFIRHLKPNLALGGGLSLNNVLGYPMVFPAFYLNWETGEKYVVKVSLMNSLEVSAGYKVNKNLRLSLIAEMNGQLATLKQEGEDKVITHIYLVTGIRPEIKINDNISIPLTLGVSAFRPTEIKDRDLKGIFKDKGYHFQSALYASAGLNIRFQKHQ